MRDFTFYAPTRILFGKGKIAELPEHIAAIGKKVLLATGGGSVKRTGIYGALTELLQSAGIEWVELDGIQPNPKITSVEEGVKLCKQNKVKAIVALGGGSVIDCCKAIAAGVYHKGDLWEMVENNDITRALPLFTVLTMAATGSEMNGGSVITNHAQKLKIGHVFGEEAYPKFSVLNPEFTFTLPAYQMKSGFFDIMSHILEQYFSDSDDSTSDYISEGLLRSLIHSARIAVKDPENYEARSNIMWTATWALNTLIAKGKTTDWEVHMIGQAVGAYTDATHGMTLSAVSMPYYRLIMPYAPDKFARYAVNVWGVNASGKSTEEVAAEGLDEMEKWMKEIGLVMNVTDLGVTPDMLDGIVKATFLNEGGYKALTAADVRTILEQSM